MSHNQAPSAGVKVRHQPIPSLPTHILTPKQVHLGENAPTTREGAGAINSESLAAESISSGGGFASNRGAQPGSGPTQTKGHVSAPGEGGQQSSGGGSGSLENQSSYAGTAPSYVNRLYQQGEGGPKGKNLKEVDSFDDAKPGEQNPEVGSEQDPGRVAEAEFGLRMNAAGRDAGEKHGEIQGSTKYAGLESETSA
jgi:hypothetical protein